MHHAASPLHERVHKLRGSAGMYGYAVLSEAARRLDQALTAARSEPLPLSRQRQHEVERLVATVISTARELDGPTAPTEPALGDRLLGVRVAAAAERPEEVRP